MSFLILCKQNENTYCIEYNTQLHCSRPSYPELYYLEYDLDFDYFLVITLKCPDDYVEY